MDQVDESVFKTILQHYLQSAESDQFNGILPNVAFKSSVDEQEIRASIIRQIGDDRVDAVFQRRDSNPHIKRLPILPKNKQIEFAGHESLTTFCLYPSESALAQAVGPTQFSDRPFSRMMLLGAAQLDFHSFEMTALSRYVSDPRFSVAFFDYMGNMSIRDKYYLDENFIDRDKISIQTFGIGFDESGTPHLIVFNRYLTGLSAEHQQYWNSYKTPVRVPMCYQYYQSSILGNWWENRSGRYAIQEEMRLVNEMSELIWQKPIFRKLIDESIPIGLTAFLSPTSENLSQFYHNLDKLLSENIVMNFFEGKISPTREITRKDGSKQTINKGSIAMLEEWLSTYVTGPDAKAIVEHTVSPLKAVRKARQAPAHKIILNEFSNEFYIVRRKMLALVLDSLACLRTIVSRDPLAKSVEIPEWLDSTKIDIF